MSGGQDGDRRRGGVGCPRNGVGLPAAPGEEARDPQGRLPGNCVMTSSKAAREIRTSTQSRSAVAVAERRASARKASSPIVSGGPTRAIRRIRPSSSLVEMPTRPEATMRRIRLVALRRTGSARRRSRRSRTACRGELGRVRPEGRPEGRDDAGCRRVVLVDAHRSGRLGLLALHDAELIPFRHRLPASIRCRASRRPPWAFSTAW